jgi:hypothetical protein
MKLQHMLKKCNALCFLDCPSITILNRTQHILQWICLSTNEKVGMHMYEIHYKELTSFTGPKFFFV